VAQSKQAHQPVPWCCTSCSPAGVQDGFDWVVPEDVDDLFVGAEAAQVVCVDLVGWRAARGGSWTSSGEWSYRQAAGLTHGS
jgi:hypothetical protein